LISLKSLKTVILLILLYTLTTAVVGLPTSIHHFMILFPKIPWFSASND